MILEKKSVIPYVGIDYRATVFQWEKWWKYFCQMPTVFYRKKIKKTNIFKTLTVGREFEKAPTKNQK